MTTPNQLRLLREIRIGRELINRVDPSIPDSQTCHFDISVLEEVLRDRWDIMSRERLTRNV